jgi:predicted Zn-dependent protease with MMP-like domain
MVRSGIMARRRHGQSWHPVIGARANRRRAFEERVAAAIDSLPGEIRAQMRNLAIVVEEEPGDDLFGLYASEPMLPDVITIYRGPLERAARSQSELDEEVRITVLHEVAHHFGIDDERLRELGWG